MTEVQMDVPTIAAEIATELGDGWSASLGVSDTNEDAFLIGPDGLELHVRHNRDITKGQFQVGLSLRQLSPFQWLADRLNDINVSTTKTPRRIAGDITSRLLPKAIPVLRDAQTRKRAQEEREAAIASLAEEIRAAMGDSARVNKDNHFVRLGDYADETRAEIDPRHGSIFFKVTTTPERAILLAQAIGRL
ncbi:hypothetical protein JNUCC0626_40255 [Lentzea sp. JNUCC 0626]|uniref:hypothetical protein n=1 Tax=Lentzea sp. JNUCC 0626 TaxID=3367513 RepID=UPI003747D319